MGGKVEGWDAVREDAVMRERSREREGAKSTRGEWESVQKERRFDFQTKRQRW